MFKKVLVANRGEIAVRIIRACRDMGIETVALYSGNDRNSLHVRIADECMAVKSELRYGDAEEVLEIARRTGADAIHPGYGFLAEEPEFARACAEAGITFIGPKPEVLEALRNKIQAMETVRRAGFNVPAYSETAVPGSDTERLAAMADDLGYPLVVKSNRGGRGRGSRVIHSQAEMKQRLAVAEAEAQRIYGNDLLYLERAIEPSYYVAVQVLADTQGNIIHLGEREGSVLLHNQKLIEESPAPCLGDEQRTRLWQAALEIARLFAYENAGTVEFIVDREGRFYFTEMKGRIQIEHPVSEMVSDVDIVREQICIAAGDPLSRRQEDVELRGHAMQCRINAEDPWNRYLPSPGELRRFRLPGGLHVRVDTYGYVGCRVPVRFDPLLANVVVWGQTRAECLQRMRRALEDFKIVGVQTNLPLHIHILNTPEFVAGNCDISHTLTEREFTARQGLPDFRRDLAAAAAVAFVLRREGAKPTTPARLSSGWHRSSRRLPS